MADVSSACPVRGRNANEVGTTGLWRSRDCERPPPPAAPVQHSGEEPMFMRATLPRLAIALLCATISTTASLRAFGAESGACCAESRFLLCLRHAAPDHDRPARCQRPNAAGSRCRAICRCRGPTTIWPCRTTLCWPSSFRSRTGDFRSRRISTAAHFPKAVGRVTRPSCPPWRTFMKTPRARSSSRPSAA